MKALVKAGREKGLVLTNVDRPKPGPTDVLIKVTSAAICGTDLHIYNWDQWAQANMAPPVIVGHEFVGVIERVGTNVTDLTAGTRVAGEGHITCGRCRSCRAGDPHLCSSTVGIGIQRDGCFAEYIVIPATNAYPIPDSIPDSIAAILDPLGNAVHTALSFDLVGEDILITGAGPIGQMAAAICRHAGARHIVITDIEPDRLSTAEQMGVSRAVVPTGTALDEVMDELNMTEGFDVALEMSGSPKAINDILEHTKTGAQVALLGLFSEAAEVNLNKAILKGITVKGIYGREMFETWYKAIAMLDSGLDIDPVISHHYPLTEYNEAFETLMTGKATKVILNIADSE